MPWLIDNTVSNGNIEIDITSAVAVMIGYSTDKNYMNDTIHTT